MKILNSKIHGYLDYGVVILFLAAPTLFGLTGIPATIAYTLAVVHLLVTVITAFPLGIFQLLPLPLHGTVELVVSFALIALPWIFGFASDLAARNFYIAAGVLIFAVWLITDYKAITMKKTPDRF